MLFERLGGLFSTLIFHFPVFEQARKSKIMQSAPRFMVEEGFLCGLVACNSAYEPTTL